jgi:hypothetical protein
VRPADASVRSGRDLAVIEATCAGGEGALGDLRAVQEGQGDVGGQAGEDRFAAGPVPIQQGGELVDRHTAGLDVVGALAGQRLQFQGFGQGGSQRAQLVAVDAQVVGQLERVGGVSLARAAPQRGRMALNALGWVGITGCPAPWRRSRVVAIPVSMWASAHRSVFAPVWSSEPVAKSHLANARAVLLL